MKKFLKVLLIIVAVCAVMGIITYLMNRPKSFDWPESGLAEKLPAPKVTKGDIRYDDDERLWVDLNGVSESQYSAYINECKKNGFDVEAEKSSYGYTAYNEEGYSLEVSYYSGSKKMSIQLEPPMEMDTISWPINALVEKLPTPPSTVGNISYESSEEVDVCLGEISKKAYAEYVKACIDAGFDVDYSKSDDSYEAKDAAGNELYIGYKGGNVIEIILEASDETATTTVPPRATTKATTAKPTTKKTTKATAKPTTKTDGSGILDPQFKAYVDGYEQFIDDYVDFMQRYNASDNQLSMMSEYLKMMSDHTEWMAGISERIADSNVGLADLAYYYDALARIEAKLATLE